MLIQDQVHTVLCVVGARSNFMKIAPIMRAFHAHGGLRTRLLHTGQRYDDEMKRAFFEELSIPEPDIDLGVGAGSHALQTVEVMRRFEPVLDAEKPDAVLVVGDVNSALACALVAAKKQVPVVHVEAGLRSYDRSMPEEINRVLTDQISDLLFTTERSADFNLVREGVASKRIYFVGNVMIDTLLQHIERAVPAAQTLQEYGASATEPYGVVTLHHSSNVEDPYTLKTLVEVLRRASDALPLIFPLHPRTRAGIEAAGLLGALATPRIIVTQPLGYLEMLGLMAHATLVLTDSGGIQEETAALGVPCLTLRDNTERPVTVEQGTNTVVGTHPQRILAAFMDVVQEGGKAGRMPELWDGKAAQRIARILSAWLVAHTTHAQWIPSKRTMQA